MVFVKSIATFPTVIVWAKHISDEINCYLLYIHMSFKLRHFQTEHEYLQ